uniref:Uncharacterized protein n=1 Tax=Zea mays TaxID=4577 RepID=A0A804UAA7_MAIZE
MGRAINKTVMVVELIKRRIVGLHQNTTTGSTDITDMWEPLEEGLLPLETTRHVSMITITLSKKELDTSYIGYAYCTVLSAAFNDFLCQFVLTKFYGFLCHELTSRCVKSELELLSDGANVYKLIGPVLVKHDLAETKANVKKHIEYISAELKRMDRALKDLEEKQNNKKESQCEGSLNEEYNKFQETYDMFCKEKDAHMQTFRGGSVDCPRLPAYKSPAAKPAVTRTPSRSANPPPLLKLRVAHPPQSCHPEQGNPHFVRDVRVLVKPYKEKGKVPGRFRKLQHAHHGGAEFAGCASPTGLLDSRDPYALLLLSGAQVVEDGLREASFEIGLDDQKVHKEMDEIYTVATIISRIPWSPRCATATEVMWVELAAPLDAEFRFVGQPFDATVWQTRAAASRSGVGSLQVGGDLPLKMLMPNAPPRMDGRLARALIIQMDANNLLRFSWDCSQGYWILNKECKRMLVRHLQPLKRSHWMLVLN